MSIIKRPFFFSDEKFISDVAVWKNLLNKSFEAIEQAKNNDKEILNTEEGEKVILYCLAVINAYTLFLTMTTNILNKIPNDSNLIAEYGLFTIPLINVVSAQIFQYLFPDETFEALLHMAEMQKENVMRVHEIVKKNTENA